MAVNFGRLGTVTFGRNANIVCTPESQITAPAAPAADVTPNAVNWTDVSAENTGGVTSITQTINGISTTISLSITVSPSGAGNSTPEYSKNGGTWTPFTTNGGVTITVNNNDTLAFRHSIYFTTTQEKTYTVTNTSDNNTVLDTFTMTAISDQGGG